MMKISIIIAAALAAGIAKATDAKACGSKSGKLWKPKTTLTDQFCVAAATKLEDCQDECCIEDSLLCGGATYTCDGGTVKDADKYEKDAGSGTDMKTNCCTAVATCETMQCPSGKKKKTNAANIKCDGLTCADSEATKCCDPDAMKCLGSPPTCDIGTFLDSAKNDKDVGSDEQAACCTAKASCDSLQCPGGMKKRTDAANLTCAGATCADSEATTCCDPDATKCLGSPPTCDVGTFLDSAKNDKDVGSDAKAACCTAKASCSDFFAAHADTKTASAAFQHHDRVSNGVIAAMAAMVLIP